MISIWTSTLYLNIECINQTNTINVGICIHLCTTLQLYILMFMCYAYTLMSEYVKERKENDVI